ncbi:MAG: PilZ domain-containing protein [Phycisphaerae bacterium]|nr:PilZ domain-containing protein [Tepidisphaeraceae bacterium]
MQLTPQLLGEILEGIKANEEAASAQDKRRFARIAIVTRLNVMNDTTGDTYTALTRDLSLEGVGLMQAAKVVRGQQVTLALPRAKGPAVTVQCAVRHVRELADNLWGAGLSYLRILSGPGAKAALVEASRIQQSILG